MRLGNNTQSYISWIDLGCPLQKTKPRELFGKRVTLIYFTHVWLKSEDISELLNTTKVDFQKKKQQKMSTKYTKKWPQKSMHKAKYLHKPPQPHHQCKLCMSLLFKNVDV